MNVRRWLAILALLSAVGACGGSGGGTPEHDGVQPGDVMPGDDADATPEAIPWDGTDDGLPPGDGTDDPGTNPDVDQPDTPTPDGTPDTDHETVTPGSNYFPSSELTIKILGPASGETASALGSITSLGGAVFGKYDSITWRNKTNAANGMATGAPFWKTGQVTLAQGDNVIEVTATSGTETAHDAITVTYNPGFRWDRTLEARPPAVFVGDTYSIYVTAWMAFYSNYSAGTVTIIEVDDNGQLQNTLATMKDDGGGSSGSGGASCDPIQGDGIFCAIVKLNTATPRVAHLRATAQVTAGAASYKAYSEVLDVPILARVAQTDCQDMQQLTTTVYAQYAQAFQQLGDAAQARDQVLASLQGNPLVAQVGPSAANGNGAWVVYQNGLLGGFSFPTSGMRGAPADEVAALDTLTSPLGGLTLAAKAVTLLSPFSGDFPGTDETLEFASRMSSNECPPLEVQGGAPLSGAAASLARFRAMSASGIVGIVTHGDALFGGVSEATRDAYGWPSDEAHEVLWTGEAPSCADLQQSSRSCTISQGQDPATACPKGQTCLGMSNNGNTVDGWCYDDAQVDLRLGRLAFGATYGVLPGFVEGHAVSPYPNSLIYLGACRSLFNGSLAAAFFASGAKSIFGFSGAVSSAFAYEQGKALAQALLVDRKTTGEAFEAGHADPQNPTTAFELFGADNLDVNDAAMVNPSWELGNLTGWTTAGDGRVISKLGITAPVAGKFMGVVSTGMGYTLQVGSMKQKFCIPADTNTMQFYWNYYSEEFQEFCGSQYQDPFTAALKSNAGNITMVDVTVDSLCPSSACMGCGDDYVGMYQSDVSFDQGDAWTTRWQKSKTNVSQLASQGKPVDLQFFVTDEGDSIYDTVILIDDVRFLAE